jgi:hypothetical protein
MGKKITLNQIAKTQTYKYRDIVIDSSEFKKIIKYRIKELNLKLMDVCMVNNVSYNTFKKYLEEDKSLSSPNLRQEHLINIAETLGVKIRVQIIIQKIESVDRSIFEKT